VSQFFFSTKCDLIKDNTVLVVTPYLVSSAVPRLDINDSHFAGLSQLCDCSALASSPPGGSTLVASKHGLQDDYRAFI
jgi:hypothetical protein